MCVCQCVGVAVVVVGVVVGVMVVFTEFNLGQDSKVRFGLDFKFTFSRDADVWLRLRS